MMKDVACNSHVLQFNTHANVGRSKASTSVLNAAMQIAKEQKRKISREVAPAANSILELDAKARKSVYLYLPRESFVGIYPLRHLDCTAPKA
jgi:hypothetical protein